MYINDKILVGKSEDKELSILLNMANRHGLITGASGSGKTITLKVMAESFSDAGVPVFHLRAISIRSKSASISLASKALSVRNSQCASGICTAKMAIQFARPYQASVQIFYQ